MNSETQLPRKETNFIDEFSKEIYEQTYRYKTTETVNDTFLRVAKFLASVETDKEYWTDKFYESLTDFKFLPGGRIISNAGTGLKGTSMINCFVSGFEGDDQDSMEGILAELKRQALILKSEGGYGFCVDTIRPRGAYVSGIGSQTPGSVRMLDMWNTQSAVITEGSGKKSTRETGKVKIRKGAQMVTMSVIHPDIEEFITAKQTPGRLTKFNMSVLITDDFMYACENNLKWDLIFPDIETHPKEYKKQWDGNFKKWVDSGLSVKVYYTYENANTLWDIIMKSTYNRNEPGVLFIDTINRLNNLYYAEYISATNPCIAEGTLVNTPTGYKKVETLNIGDEICTVLGSEKIKNIETHSNYPTFKIKFSDGGEQNVTAAHQYHANRKGDNLGEKRIEKIKVEDLKIGDRVRIEATKLNSYVFDQSKYNTGLKAGILIGDGCYTKKVIDNGIVKISSNQDDIEYNAKVKDLFGDIFRKDDNSKISKSMNMIMRKIDINFSELGLKSNYSYDKEIDMEMANNYSYIIGVLDGLLATDGNVNFKTNNPQIRFFTTSKKLAQNIRELLLYIGCHGRITNNFDKGGFIDGREIIRKHTKHTINLTGISVKNYFEHTHLNEIHKQKYDKLKSMVINSRLTGNGWNAAILSIEPHKNSNVYDLYCEESDTWITDGYVQVGCGEQVLPANAVCLLGSLNLTQFINKNHTDWNYDKLGEVIPTAIRLMDNVNDLTYVPLDGQKKNLAEKRRIGLGIMGYGSALMMMQTKYGSDRALKITDKLYSFIANTAYQASALLGKEKGSFLLYDEEKYLQSNYVKQALSKETIEIIKENGLRNSHLLSIQPTGNSSIFANNVSGGLEPLFLSEYIRTSIFPYPPEGLFLPKNTNFSTKEFVSDGDTVWEWKKEGDENILTTNFNEYVWKFDKNRGLVRETVVKDYAVRYLESKNQWDASAEWAATTATLNIDDHIKTMKVFAKYIDSAMSKTVNLKEDYPFEDFKRLYIDLYKTGIIKGGTTYRAGTMTTVLSAKSENNLKIKKTEALPRPKSLPCDIHHTQVQGEKWIVLVGMLYEDPYEIFAFKPKKVQVSQKFETGILTRIKKGTYNLTIGNDDFTIENITELFESDEQEALTRMISTSLRHGVDINFIHDQLQKSTGTIISFSKAIARTLKKYLIAGELKNETFDECPNNNIGCKIVREEGCVKCLGCSISKCN